MAIRKQKEPNMANDDKPKDAAFIGRVVDDPANPTPTRLLTGWLGDAGEAGYRRLYADAELSSYVDIPEDAILYTEAIRDAQPAGAVFVWIKRDAAVKQGGSAASRAGRFLQGRVAQDFSSPEKAGYRCVTQVPCAEPTGFTGQCTKQPDVGGAWPCLTALPLCSAEPTGFTGQCTHQPWPNPTRYVGCTVLHCPTNDLTQQPHICKIVESGMPGCGGSGEPPKPEGEGEGKEAVKAGPPTNIPGCGYTQTWGLCETHIGCPPETNIPGCGWTQQWGLCNDTQAPKCQPSVQIPCITQDAACAPTRIAQCFETEGVEGGGQVGKHKPQHTPLCVFQITAGLPCFFKTRFEPQCIPRDLTIFRRFPGFVGAAGAAESPTAAECHPSIVDACPTRFRCDTQPPTAFCTSVLEHCPTHCGRDCQTPQPQCTSINCTHAGPQCPEPTIGIACTAVSPQCPDRTIGISCTILPPQCPRDTIGFACTAVAPQCPPPTQSGPQCPTPATMCKICTNVPQICAAPDVAAVGAPHTQSGPQCPTPATMCFVCTNVPRICGVPEVEAVGAPNTAATTCTQFGHQCLSAVDACPTRLCGGGGGGGGQTAATVCTQFGHQCLSAVDACPTRLCAGGAGQQFAAVRTQSGPQCPTPATMCFVCTNVPELCGRTAATVCTQSGPECPTPATMCFVCTNVPELCGVQQAAVGAPNTAATTCTQFGQQCRSAVDACPTRLCDTRFGCGGGGQTAATVCTQFGPQCPTPATMCFVCTNVPELCRGGGQTAATVCTQVGQQCLSAVDACPTRLCGQQQFAAAPGGGFWPTPMTRCFVC